MIYVGYFRPFELPSANRVELINESLIIVCTYSLICFSAFVSDAETRYQCGWVLIVLIICIVIFNLILMVFDGIKSIKRAIQLRLIRRKNLRLA